LVGNIETARYSDFTGHPHILPNWKHLTEGVKYVEKTL